MIARLIGGGQHLIVNSKLMISYFVSDRSTESARVLAGPRWPVTDRIQIATDGWGAYLRAIEGAFMDSKSFAGS